MKKMCRLSVALLPVLAVMALPGQALAASGSWFTQGSGTVVNTGPYMTGATERWQWVATSNVGTYLTGASAKGHFSARIPGTNIGFDADVTCLNVSGDSARINITVTRSSNPSRMVGAQTSITMTSIGQGFDALHQVGADGRNNVPPQVCDPPSGARDPFYGTIGIRSEASPYSWLAQGSGNISFSPDDHYQFIALSDVGGGNARGHVTELDSSTGLGFSADVLCLSVTGNSARIGMRVTESTNPAYPLGGGKYINITETGQGNNETDQFLPDGAVYPAIDPFTFRPLGCPAPIAGGYPWDGTMNVRG
jgi:sRNA-binding carbon storage regulator CsrA